MGGWVGEEADVAPKDLVLVGASLVVDAPVAVDGGGNFCILSLGSGGGLFCSQPPFVLTRFIFRRLLDFILHKTIRQMVTVY